MELTICLERLSPGQTLDIVYELEDQYSYERHVDFTYAFHPRITNEHPPYNIIRERYTAFTFQDEMVATWFRLRYG
jgi:hypothetical protein